MIKKDLINIDYVIEDINHINLLLSKLFTLIESNSLIEEKELEVLMSLDTKIFNLLRALEYEHKEILNIEDLNKQVIELKNALNNNIGIYGIKTFFYDGEAHIRKWWKEQGFLTVSNFEFGNYGFRCDFSLLTNFVSSFSENYIEKKKALELKIEEINNKFDVIKMKNKYIILDTSKNREIILNLIEDKFKKDAKIKSWNNILIKGTDKYRLTGFNCTIKDLDWLKKEE